MGPFMAIIRPIAAIFTAAFTGLFVNALDAKSESQSKGPTMATGLTPLGAPLTPPGGS